MLILGAPPTGLHYVPPDLPHCLRQRCLRQLHLRRRGHRGQRPLLRLRRLLPLHGLADVSVVAVHPTSAVVELWSALFVSYVRRSGAGGAPACQRASEKQSWRRSSSLTLHSLLSQHTYLLVCTLLFPLTFYSMLAALSQAVSDTLYPLFPKVQHASTNHG